MIQRLFLLTMTICCLSCTNDRSIVKLKMNNYPDSTILFLSQSNSEHKDSGYILNNTIEFIVENSTPVALSINTDYTKFDDFEYLTVWKEDRPIVITASKGKLSEAEVTGSEIQNQIKTLEKQQKKYQDQSDSLRELYNACPKSDTQRRKEIRTLGIAYQDTVESLEIKYIEEHPNYYYSSVLLKYALYNLPKPKISKLYNALSAENKTNEHAEAVHQFLKYSKELQVGDSALNFVANDLNGESISLNDYRGKYVLLDFWSSNCGACLIEMPVLKKKYEQYKSQDFEIVGYCLDESKETWQNTVNKHHVTWTTITDLTGYYGKTPMNYDVFVFPTYFMIDKEGKIIGKIEGRRGLEEMIDQTFKKES